MFSFGSHAYPVGQSPIEKLPFELLHKILMFVSSPPADEMQHLMARNLPVNPNAKIVQPPCLLPCLLASRTLFAVALPVMYRNIEASRISTLEKALVQITQHQTLGGSVRKLDLSGFCWSANTPQSTSNPLLEALSHTPLLREFYMNKCMHHHLNSEVLQKLLCDLPFLKTIDLSGCNSPPFVDACSTLLDQNRPVTKSIKSVCLAGCTDIPAEFFEWVLPQLPSLQYLDVSNTQIMSAALSGIPVTAKLANLNIGHCYALNEKEIVDFLIRHSSAEQLAYLNMETNPGIEYQVLSEDDISRLLPNLPTSLRILSLKNTAMTSARAPFLKRLSAQLEELSLGSNLRFQDVESLFTNPESPEDEEMESNIPEGEDAEEVDSKYQTVLTPMEEAIAICKLRQRINSFPEASSSDNPSKLRYLDISSLPIAEQSGIRTSILLGPQLRLLEIVEVSEKVVRRLEVLPKLCRAVGWEVTSVGRRCWLRRRDVG